VRLDPELLRLLVAAGPQQQPGFLSQRNVEPGSVPTLGGIDPVRVRIKILDSVKRGADDIARRRHITAFSRAQ
jgi:hypothetical protein